MGASFLGSFVRESAKVGCEQVLSCLVDFVFALSYPLPNVRQMHSLGLPIEAASLARGEPRPMLSYRNLMTVAAVAALGISLAACSSSSDDPDPVEETPPAETMAPEPEQPAPPSDLETTQAAALTAANAAKAASDAADTAAEGAEAGTADLATLQTGEMARMYAEAAREAAETAMAEYMKAKTASDAAAAATTASAAGAARADAEAAQMAAMEAQTEAEGAAMKASEAAMMELMIDGKDKSVGESSLNAGDGMLTTTNDDDSKTITGRLDGEDPMNSVAAKLGQAGAQDNPNTPANEAETPMASVEAMDVSIGRTLDSSDDTARLMLVTHYAGTKMVKVFDYTGADDANTETTTDGRILVAGTAGTDGAEYSPLVYRGMYYPAADNTSENGLSVADTADDGTNASDRVAEDAEAMRVYSFVDVGTDGALGGGDDVTTYVVLHSSTTEGGTTTETYRPVDITVTLPAVGNASATPPEISHPAKEVSAMAELADAKEYEHIHFGVWAGLGEAEEDGTQEVDDLGIGFVQSIGGGMTENMPNQKSATYSGDWVAAVQGASEGAISLEHGPATLTANLDKSTLTATLTGLATLSGAIDGSTFKGTKVAVSDGDPYGLNSDGSFDGTFSGGFYGDMAAEAGGVFDFTSDDIADGAFRGAFGADRKDNEQ
ncbi:MAG: transferrin-binding protein-like solute binding protein [Rhodospirillales bacterium]|nr:transferrin-binding protein-like solute binding protein [Rhodospirillales bacterium]